MATKKVLFKHLVETVDENYQSGKGYPLNRLPLRPLQKVAPVEDLSQGGTSSTGAAGFLNESVTITGANTGAVLNVSATNTGTTASFVSGEYTIVIPPDESLIAAHLIVVTADVQASADAGGYTNWIRVKFEGTHANTTIGTLRVPQVQKCPLPSIDTLALDNAASIDNDNNPSVTVVGVSSNEVTIRISGLSVGSQGYLLSFTGF